MDVLANRETYIYNTNKILELDRQCYLDEVHHIQRVGQ